MIKKILPLVLIIIGGGAGVAAGLVLKPAPAADVALDETHPCGDPQAHAEAKTEKEEAPKSASPEDISFEYAKLSNQFIVPIIRDEVVTAMAVMTLSIEVKSGTVDDVYSVEPRLRNEFLQAMFDHAAIGGFDGAFANNQNLKRLRFALKEKAYGVLGDRVNDVLITDIARQDM